MHGFLSHLHSLMVTMSQKSFVPQTAKSVSQALMSDSAITIYRLRDESHASILIACTKCDWKAAFDRDELIAAYGADYPLPNLLNFVAAPGCSRVGSQWDRCGAYYVEPIEGAR